MHYTWAILRVAAAASVAVLPAPCQFLRGVNLAGAEFAENKIPGVINTDYTYNSEATFRYFASKNMTLLRIPVRWERMQPVLFAPLDQANLDALRRNAAWAAQYGLKIVIDVHNYGRYKLRENGAVNEYVIDGVYNGVTRVSASALADLWRRLSTEFQAEAAVYAYDLMNEPHDMGSSDWKAISQAALGAIRANGDRKLVFVGGDSWSSAARWPQVHGPSGWIVDPADNFAYEAHQYLDSDASGTYTKTFDQELAVNPDLMNVGRARLAPFASWCRANRARCFLGEYGVPGNDPRWLAALDNFLYALDEAGMDGVYWAGGEWWGDYPLSVHPQANYTVDRPQMAVLQAHAGRNPLTAVPAASYADAPLAPGSLASVFGKNLRGANVRLELTDSAGRTVTPPLLAATASQVNLLVPADIALGRATLILRSDAGILGGGAAQIVRISPSLFSADGTGQGTAAGQIIRLRANGETAYEPLTAPVSFDNSGDRLFLVLYGTGFRAVASPTLASLRVGDTPVVVTYAGAQPDFPGLDQLNAELPASLAGAGQLRITLTVEGRTANPVSMSFQ